MNKKTLLVAIVLFILTAGISYGLFSLLKPKIVVTPPPTPQKLANGSTVFDQNLPKTQPCPLNGVKYSTQQQAWWEKHRPLIIMIENHTEARPQSGLSFADEVYEGVAEGGITRFAAVYYCQDAPENGPVRSARTYFVDFASEFGMYPLYAHVGGANAAGPADALGQITSYGWDNYNDLNEFAVPFPVYWRDYERMGHPVATEHTMYTSTTKLWNYAATDRGITTNDKDGQLWNANFVQYAFKDDQPTKNSTQTIHVGFWTGGDDYAVDWIYDPANNNYKRNNGGQPHLDLDTKKQLTAKNVVILWMKEVSADDGYEDNIHLLYKNIGTGKADIFMDGKRITGTWKKASRTSRTLLYDASGNPITFDRGVIWFTILPLTGDLTVK